MPLEIIKWVILAIVFIFALTALTGAPYVPSKKRELRLLFENLYSLNKNDLLVDLGAGDGVVLKVASEFGASGFGVELNPFLAVIAKIRLRKNKKITVHCGNLFKANFPDDTTVVYLFGNGRDISRMTNVVKKQAKLLKKDIYLISYGFKIQDLKPINEYRAYYLYKISHSR